MIHYSPIVDDNVNTFKLLDFTPSAYTCKPLLNLNRINTGTLVYAVDGSHWIQWTQELGTLAIYSNAKSYLLTSGHMYSTYTNEWTAPKYCCVNPTHMIHPRSYREKTYVAKKRGDDRAR